MRIHLLNIEVSMKAKSISEYIKTAPLKGQEHLKLMRQTILDAAPKATEEIKWSMPCITNGKILVCYGAFKNHIGFYPGPSVISQFSEELQKFKNARGSVQFPYDQKLPLGLIRKMVKFRLKENEEQLSR
jgi:uncharacterized protein YdhG (YjbR/CyaY superfamily)